MDKLNNNEEKTVDIFSVVIGFGLGLLFVRSVGISGFLPVSFILYGFYIIIDSLRNRKKPNNNEKKTNGIDRKELLKQFCLKNKIVLTALILLLGIISVWNYLDNIKKQEIDCLKRLKYSIDGFYYITELGVIREFKTQNEGMNYCLKTFLSPRTTLNLDDFKN